MSQKNELRKQRLEAAEASAGGSSDPVYSEIIRQVEQSEATGRVLDFGAGSGNLARQLIRLKKCSRVDAIDITGYDGKDHIAGVQWLFSDLNNPVPVEDASYDFVVAAEVIEHLENPRFVAREWYRLLRPGGVLVMSTPNNESWRSIFALILRGHFVAFGENSYPAHITALLSKDIKRVLHEAGFSDISFSYTDYGKFPGMPTTTWQRLSLELCSGRRFSDNIVCQAKKKN